MRHDRDVVEKSVKKMEESIEQTRAQTVALNLRTFRVMSEHFSSFCRTLVREVGTDHQIPEKDVRMVLVAAE